MLINYENNATFYIDYSYNRGSLTVMNSVINKISTPTYKNISFKGRSNQQKIERNNNSTRNILLSSLIALASLSIPIETKADVEC